MDKQKIILIGNGDVGSSYAFALVAQDVGQELGIIDLDKSKVEGDALDLAHGLAYTRPKKIFSANYTDCSDADLVVITAGAAQKDGETRLDLVAKNIQIVKSIVDEVMKSGFDGIFLIASNPVDILTYAVQRFSGLPKHRVIGSGTSLDSARFRQSIAELTGVDARDVHAYILGEHGDTQFPVWSHANIGGMQVDEWLKTHPEIDEAELKHLFISVRDAAYTIIDKKGSTHYGIAIALSRITKAIFQNEKAILPLSVFLDGLYGEEDVCIGAPAVLSRNGIEQIIEMPLNAVEEKQLAYSAQTIRSMQESALKQLD